MSVIEKANKEYKELCQKLGFLTLRKQQIVDEMKDVKEKITELLETSNKMIKLEAEIRADIEGEKQDERSERTGSSCSTGLPSDESGNNGKD